jgi:hypothetical protein
MTHTDRRDQIVGYGRSPSQSRTEALACLLLTDYAADYCFAEEENGGAIFQGS